jgi:O-antigen/teichoic acid export membrane protein
MVTIGVRRMNNKAHAFIKNFSYTFASNLISLLVSTLVVIIIPKLVGVEEYGYWQLYLFYASYVGFLQFGWNDGIYLRYGGKEYNELDKGLFFSQFWMLTISQIIIAIIIIVLANIFLNKTDMQFILTMVALCLIVTGIRTMSLLILQATNRIKEYAQITILDRAIYCCLMMFFIAANVREYKILVVADLIGRFISLLYAMYSCRDMFFRKVSTFYFSFREALVNINVGIKLMFSNISSMLIIGVVRFGIERSWDVSTFGKVSLTLSISNLMMLFINSVGIILFPILRRTDKKNLPSIYLTMRDFLMVALLGMLIAYYPLKVVLSAWLPKYADSMIYMALVFPMCVFEGKMALLINTYLKTLRKEKLMLKINLIALFLSIIITFGTVVSLKNLTLAIASIVFLLAFRCTLAELFLSKILKIRLYKDMGFELMMTSIFILTGWFVNSWLAVLLYGMAYSMYLIIKRKDINGTIKNIKLLMKSHI